MSNPISRLVTQLGPLRTGLSILVLISIAFIPAPGDSLSYHGWGVLKVALGPVMAPTLFMVLLLDTIMSRVFMVDADADTRRRLATVVKVNLGLAALIVLLFVPFLLSLTR